jgi:two-component system response regulator ChvI
MVLIDDDLSYCEAIACELAEYQCEVIFFTVGSAMFEYFELGETADVIVLDWQLQACSGADLIPKLRRHGIRIPILMLTGSAGIAQEIEALERGALDFVDKSRGASILAKRARLIADADKPKEVQKVEEILHCGDLVLRPRLSRALWKGVNVDLTVTEFNIVRKLVSNIGEHVTYRGIYDCVHPVGFIAGYGEDGYRTNVRSLVKRIRNKFRTIDATFSEIENFPAFGYCWSGSGQIAGRA